MDLRVSSADVVAALHVDVHALAFPHLVGQFSVDWVSLQEREKERKREREKER